MRLRARQADAIAIVKIEDFGEKVGGTRKGKAKPIGSRGRIERAKEGEGGNVAIFSRPESSPLPESGWLSVQAITEQLEQLGKPFRTAIPVAVVDRLSDIGIESNPDDGVTSGVTFKGKIYLFRDGLVDSAAVARTYWHELLDFGLRRFLTRDQSIRQLGELYAQDAWLRNRADAWVAGPVKWKLSPKQQASSAASHQRLELGALGAARARGTETRFEAFFCLTRLKLLPMLRSLNVYPFNAGF